jgi:hypothetical protein
MGTQITPRQLGQQAQEIIQHTYLIGSAPADPHKLLTDLARSVTVFGHMLQSLSDQYGQVGRKFASWIAYAGKVFWGIVELSVPTSVFRYLFRNWLSLFALVGIVTIAVGLLAKVSGMSGIGVGMLIVVILLALSSGLLRYYMLKATIPPYLFAISRLGLIFIALLLLTYLAVYHGPSIANILQSLEKFFRWSGGFKMYLSGHSMARV